MEVLNANLQLAVERGQVSPRGSVHRQPTWDFSLPISRDGSDPSDGSDEAGRLGGLFTTAADEAKTRAYQELPSRIVELLKPAPAPTTCLDYVRRLRWAGLQPHSLLYWGATAQLVGAVFFNVGCVYGLPHMAETHLQEALLVYLTCLLGSACFSFASYVYVLEASHSSSLRWLSDEPVTLGYVVSWFNLLGSLCFFLASCCYFIQVPPYEGLTAGGEWGWEYQVSEWGVRFTFGVGSICFLVAAILAFPELLSD